ncbi:MAG: hypothetical protein ACOC9R_02305 [bacterium]
MSTLDQQDGAVDVHGVQPWSVLRQDSRIWQRRKAEWRALGLRDRGGRPDATVWQSGPGSRMHGRISGQGGSVFDAVLAEACLTWYSPPGGLVLDPMAGGPTRGIVAAALGSRYVGMDLLGEQVAANLEMRDGWPEPLPGSASWVTGDARTALPDVRADYVFSCPPYWRLERYSDDPRDLSAMTLDAYLSAHADIIRAASDRLADDRFATWVVGDLRGGDGHLCRLPWHTVEAFHAAGLRLVNDQILVTPVGSRMWNLARAWRGTRSATRLHQYVLTFVKGDRRRAVARIREGL